jgi:Ca2+-transporting ATPase
MDDAALRARVPEVAVYARVAPEHKLRVVQAFQSQGEVVAVTGDGVNDAPALKAAQIGVAMGKSGTDVAREASDMVLADDNFVSIYAAVEEGRITFDNLRKVTFFLISTGAAEVLAILTTLIVQWPLPFLPAQILWLNLVTNGLQDVALAFEPGEPGVLKRPPRRTGEGIISRLLWERTLVAGLVMAAGTLLLFWWELEASGQVGRAQTVALTTMVLFQVFHVGNCRSEHRSVFALSPWSNPFLFAATAAALAVHVAALYLPPTQFLLRVEPLELDSWVRMAVVASTILLAVEAHKVLRRARSSRPSSSQARPAGPR